MKTQAPVVVIGGGIAGVSTLYHLTQEGWNDVVLVERDDLTTGSTWHAAGQVAHFGASQTQIALKKWSTELYRELAADPEYPIDYHVTGGTRLAYTQDEVDTYRHLIDVARGMSVDTEYIDASELKRRHPLMNTERVLGAWWDPHDGDIDPSQLTLALARRARAAGAEIYRSSPAQSIRRHANGEFTVQTPNGDIRCDMVVNATGYRVNEVGKMLGVVHPVTAMEHMYFLTEPVAALQQREQRLPILRCTETDFYCRQEKQGLLVGIYEQACKTFGMDGIDPDFTRDLCPSDLDRCLPNVERIFERLPVLGEVGIHSIVCGPIPYSLDGSALIGPVPGVPNAFAALGLRIGIGDGGGYGKALAQIMVHGECEFDTWVIDPRRFTQYANTELSCIKAVEDYQNEFHLHMPHEHRSAGRLARTTPLYTALDKLNCVWGVVNGWERSLFFRPNEAFQDEYSYRFTATDTLIGKEVGAVASGVGLMEISGFNRYEIKGEGATDCLNRVITNTAPEQVGRVKLCYLLTEQGNVLSEATITKLGDEHYWYGSAAGSEWHDRDWLLRYCPNSVVINELTSTHTILVVAGPGARKLLQSLSPRCDWSREALPWMSAKTVFIGYAQVLAACVSFCGEHGYELHVPNEQLLLTWTLICEAGDKHGLVHFGLRALESMRLEKGYRHWKADLTVEHNPFESGVDRFVNLSKDDFVGKSALEAQLKKGPRKLFVNLVVDCEVAPASTGCPIFHGDIQIGSVTSGGYGHRIMKNLAFAFVEPAFSEIGTRLEVGILGLRYPAVISEICLYDPQNRIMKN